MKWPVSSKIKTGGKITIGETTVKNGAGHGEVPTCSFSGASCPESAGTFPPVPFWRLRPDTVVGRNIYCHSLHPKRALI